MIDLAVFGDESTVVLALDDALRRGLTSVPALLEQVDRFGPLRPGTKLMRRLLDRRISQAIPESIVESMFDELLRQAGLPQPTRQFKVFRADGVYVGRADFAFPECQLLIEIQSVRHHGAVDDQIYDDRRKAAFASAGYRVIPIWSNDIRTRPTHVVALIRDALSR